VGEAVEVRRIGRDDELAPWPSPAAEPILDAAGKPRGAFDPEPDSAQAVLELAQTLTDRLATMRVASHHADTVRLARAMALNVVDLLEGVARR